MRRYDRRQRLLAAGLAALAGFVDALGFLRLDGKFVSFMSGNSTRMAVGIEARTVDTVMVAALIASFVVGVMAGAIVARTSGRWRKPIVLGLVTIFLTVAAAVASVTPDARVPTLLMAAAMGAANDVFLRDGEVSVAVTYMTGTLVKFGQHLAAACTGGPIAACLPYLILWFSLVGGAVIGAAVYPALELQALWIAAGVAGVLTIAARALGPVAEAAEPRTA